MVSNESQSTQSHPANRPGPRCVFLVMILAGAGLLWATVVGADPWAQEAAPTRAESLRRQREARAAEKLSGRRRTGFEKLLGAVENTYLPQRVMAGWRGVHPFAGDFPSKSGFGFGIGFTDEAVGTIYPRDDLHNRVNVRLGAAKTTRDYTDLRAEIDVMNVGGTRLGFRLKARYWEWKQMPFFGRGPDSQKSNESNFRWDSGELGAELVWRPGNFELTAGAAYLTPDIGPGESDEHPSVELIFDPGEIPGAEAQPNFVRYDLAIAYDRRPLHRGWTAFSGSGGGYYALRYSFYNDRDLNRFSFHRIEVEAQHYFPVKWRRAIVLRGNAVFVRSNERNQVPFFYMPTLGGRYMLRSFEEFRFYDDNRLLLTTEYRWAAWSALNMAAFLDLGKVYPKSENFSLHDLRASYGLGFRFKSAFGFLARIDLARGSEGFRTVALFENVF